MNTETVTWFSVSAQLTNREIAEKLGDGLEPEKVDRRDLVLLRRQNHGVGCRTSPGILKIFANVAPDLVGTARRSFGNEIGVS